MGKTKIFLGLFVIMIVLGFLVFWNQKSAIDWVALDSQATYYYGTNCSHCQRVAQFIEANRIGDRVPFVKKEVMEDPANSRELLAVGEKCGLSRENLGSVPLVYADGKCYLGELEAVSFFKGAAGISQ